MWKHPRHFFPATSQKHGRDNPNHSKAVLFCLLSATAAPRCEPMSPAWLHVLSWLSLGAGLACAVAIAIDEARHPQRMWIMSLVWPIVALFGSAAALSAYFAYGRVDNADAARRPRRHGHAPSGKRRMPCWVKIGKATAHCGAGCTLGDICAEWLAFAFPGIALWFGWQSLFAEKTFAVWILDYLFAFGFGVAFQYFTIAPMRHLGPARGLWEALKADALALTAWQVGMYAFMAFAALWLFPATFGLRLQPNMPEFWLVMQIAMWCGFATSFPVNRWLVRMGIKEAM